MSIIFIDDSRLFAKTALAPSELSASDVDGLCAYEAESLPIFNGDKSVKSFLRLKNSAIIYVGARSRVFDDLSAQEISSAKYIVPLSAAFASLNLDGLFALETSQSITILNFENGDAKNIASCPLSTDYNETLNNALSLAGIDNVDSIKRVRFVSAKLSGRKITISFEFLDSSGGVESVCSECIMRAKLSSAELRSLEQIKALKSAKVHCLARKILSVCAVIFVLLLFVWQGALILEKSEIRALELHFEKISPIAKRVEAQSAEIVKLSNFLGEKIRPIETLALINTMRPDSVMFERVELSSQKGLQIVGTADSITSVKTFADTINNSKQFSAQMNSDSSRGNTRFTMSISGGEK